MGRITDESNRLTRGLTVDELKPVSELSKILSLEMKVKNDSSSPMAKPEYAGLVALNVALVAKTLYENNALAALVIAKNNMLIEKVCSGLI